MTKVLFVNSTAIHGGAERALFCLMDNIRSKGIEPILLVPSRGWLVDRCIEKSIAVEFLPTLPDAFATNTFRQQAQTWLTNSVAIARLVKRYNISLIHANSPRASYHAGLGARLARVPCIVHVHDADPKFLPYSVFVKKIILLLVSDEFVTVSKFTEHSLKNFLPTCTRITTIYNGFEADISYSKTDLKEELNLQPDSFLIGNISAMAPWKGQDIIIKAFYQMIQKFHGQYYLVIIGGSQGSEEQKNHFQSLLDLTKVLGLKNRVHFTGWRKDVISLLPSIDLFVHVPIRPDPLPSVVFEACLTERPIIASNTGGIPEIIQNNIHGVLVEPSNVEQLAEVMEWSISNYSALVEMGKNAKKRVQEKFSINQMIEEFYSVYQKWIKT